MTKVYLSSPADGKARSREVCEEVVRQLRSEHTVAEVFDPASDVWQRVLRRGYEADRWNGPYGEPVNETISYERYKQLRNLMSLSTRDVLCLVPGWQRSAAAKAELASARAMGVRVVELMSSGRMAWWREDVVPEEGGAV